MGFTGFGLALCGLINLFWFMAKNPAFFLHLHFSDSFYGFGLTDMVIPLSPTKYELFLRRITQDSPARVTLAKAREIDFHPSSKLTNRWVIVCDRSKAAALHKGDSLA